MEKRHILICGERKVGKTTLIEKLINEIDKPVYGFLTRMFDADPEGYFPIYMFSPNDSERIRNNENHIGNCNGKDRSINTSVFDNLGVKLLKKQDGILVMDELGFMEADSTVFCDAVLNHFDNDEHLIATAKSNIDIDFLNKLRSHPKAIVVELSKENRDEMYKKLLPIVRSWNKD